MRRELLLLLVGSDDLLTLVGAGGGPSIVAIGEIVAGQVWINGVVAGEVT